MSIKDYVKLARNGNEKAFNWLVEHFEPLFCNNVIRFNDNNETLREKAKEKLPNFIKMYLASSYKKDIDSFLRYKASHEFKELEKIKDTRNKDKDYLISIYSKRFLKHITKYKYILTEEELERYSIKYITKLVDLFISDRNSFSNNINSRISFESKYIQDEEIFLSRYIVEEGVNDKIVDYLSNKYRYLLDEYKTKNSYFILNACYKYIISDVLDNVTSHKVSMGSYMKKQIHKKHLQIVSELNGMEDIAKQDKATRILLYYSYSSIKTLIFENYKDIVNIPTLKLKNLINQKYDIYFNNYINGNVKRDLRRHIINSFNSYFSYFLNSMEEIDNKKYVDKDIEKQENKGVII